MPSSTRATQGWPRFRRLSRAILTVVITLLLAHLAGLAAARRVVPGGTPTRTIDARGA